MKTKRLNSLAPNRVELTPEQCKTMCEKIGLTYHDGYEKRVFEYTITDETPDRSGDIVRYRGADWSNYYPSNPVVMYSHDHGSMPVGRTLDIWADDNSKSVRARAVIFGNEVDPSGASERVFRYVANGAMPSVSIGFKPKEGGVYNPTDTEERKAIGLGKYGVEFKAWDLFEYSICAIPCNPSARTKAIEDFKTKGIFVDGDDTVIFESDKSVDAAKVEVMEIEKKIDSLKEELSDLVKARSELEHDINKLKSEIKTISGMCREYAEVVEAQRVSDLIKTIFNGSVK